jgi:hypothetical protein
MRAKDPVGDGDEPRKTSHGVLSVLIEITNILDPDV